MSNEDSIKAISILVSGIDKHINNINAKYKQNLYDYKYKDLLNMNNIIKICLRCNTEFIPNYNSRNTQVYCSDDCRYNSTQDTRKELKQDSRYDRIDNLRKLIYERKYRARRDKRKMNKDEIEGYEIILLECKSLVKDRKKISYYEFNQRYNTLMQLYRNTGHW